MPPESREEMDNFKRKASGSYLARCISESQLCIENSAKAVISVFRIPSREHDPSVELLEVLAGIRKKISEELAGSLEELASIASRVAPEHIRSIYGDEKRRIPPSELYDEETATELLGNAKKACETAEKFLEEWFS